MSLTEGQIKAQVRSLRQKSDGGPRAVAIRTTTRWNGPERIEIEGVVHRVAYCHSDLEVRSLLRGGREDGIPVVALCPFESAKLADDVLARFAKRRILSPEPGEQLVSLFEVMGVDPRVLASRQLVNALVEYAPSDGYPPVATGYLDLQTAWSELIHRFLGDRTLASSLARLLESSANPDFVRRFDTFPADVRDAFFKWAAENVDPTFTWVAPLVVAKKLADLIPIGLLLDLLLLDELKGHSDVKVAWARLESWFAGHSVDQAAARSWATAAKGVFGFLRQRSGVNSVIARTLTRLDDILAELRIPELAAASEFSPAGFERRIQSFANALAGSMKTGVDLVKEVPKVSNCLRSLSDHLLATDHAKRVARCEMAVRLTRWLGTTGYGTAAASLDAMVTTYTQVGGFVDWARSIIQEGDEDASLNKAFTALLGRVDSGCAAFEANFAIKVAEWHQIGGQPGASFLPIESTLDHLAGPITGKAPCLLLVMDGMSMAVFRELIGDLTERGKWLETNPEQIAVPSALLATVPSVTEISRRALMRGELKSASKPTEQSAFDSNDRLFALTGGASRPKLFLKGSLQNGDQAGLSEEIKEAVSSKKRRLVAVVLNAIDDHLSGSDQVATRWNLEVIQPLGELLRLAAEAGRTIILTSDHGHILERKTTLKSGVGQGGDRYRLDGGPVVDGEIRIKGNRVSAALGTDEVTAAWSRDIRYAAKKRGYHGGASPQEMVIPLAVLRHLKSDLPPGWQDVSPSPYRPDWWRLTDAGAAPTVVPLPSRPSAKVRNEPDLFDQIQASPSRNAWITQLLEGDVYQEVSRRGVRGTPALPEVTRFLEALVDRNGNVPQEALAEKLGLPFLRLGGYVQNLARIFNVDGYEVLAIESGSVMLNVPLLKKQFGIGE